MQSQLVTELVSFLQPDQRVDLKAVALIHVLGLTGSDEGKATILNCSPLLQSIARLTTDPMTSISKDAVLCLINLTADEVNAEQVVEKCRSFIPPFQIMTSCIEHIIDENSPIADPWAMVLSNLTRVESLAAEALDVLEKDEKQIVTLVKAFSRINYNKQKAKLHYLGPIFCNLTQTSRGRELFCNPKYNLLQQIIPFASFEDSVVRRGGTIGVLKNICFDPVYHDTILNKEDDILYCLMYPLAGPEEFTDEENDMFPIELQYLGQDKTREDDPDLRRMILESLLQLCATKKCREFLRSKGLYEILREYHKWESDVGNDKNALLACENVVDILIRKEEEIGLDNIKHIDVPTDLAKKFVEDDELFVK